MRNLIQDLRFAARMLLKKPGFTFITVLTLALGIGANTAIFSVVNAVLLTSLPYKKPDRIMVLWGRNPSLNLSQTDFPASYPDFLDWRASNRSFEYLAAINPHSLNLSGEGDPERIGGVGVSADFFRVLGAEAAVGRTFLPEEEEPGSEPVVVLSNNFWRRRFGAQPEAVGKSITLDGKNYRIIGVMPAGFAFPRGTDMPSHFGFAEQVNVWTPLALEDYEVRQRGNRVLAVIGRLKTGVTLAEAQSEMRSITNNFEQQYPNTNRGFSVEVVPLYEHLVGKIRPGLLLLSAAVAFLLLIACANVANLLLARATARQKEIAVRTALGASRWRIVRQLITESIFLSLLGGSVGLLVSLWATDVLLMLSPASLTYIGDMRLNYRLLGFTLLISSLTGIFFSLAPALQASKQDLNETLKEGGRSATGGGNRLREFLVVAEVALTLVLLIGAGLMIKSFVRLHQENIGFNPKNVLTMQINLPLEQYKERSQWNNFFGQLVERVKAIPGVESAAVTWQLPLNGAEGSVGFEIEGRPEDPNIKYWTGMRRISPGYFQTMGITLLRGRDLNKQDVQDGKAAVINEAMAQRYWPNEDAIGQRVSTLGSTLEIVGIVRNVKNSAVDRAADPELYMPVNLWFMHLVVRTSGDPMNVLPNIRTELQAIDKNLPVSKVATMDQLVADSVAARRFNMLLLSLFAATALMLAIVGIYGVMSYTVEQNTREIGIRMALGAQVSDVLQLVVGQGLILASIGVALGLVGAFWLTRLIRSLLFSVTATDPLTFIGVSTLLLVVSLLACYVPARRAAKVDPMVALRYE